MVILKNFPHFVAAWLVFPQFYLLRMEFGKKAIPLCKWNRFRLFSDILDASGNLRLRVLIQFTVRSHRTFVVDSSLEKDPPKCLAQTQQEKKIKQNANKYTCRWQFFHSISLISLNIFHSPTFLFWHSSTDCCYSLIYLSSPLPGFILLIQNKSHNF